MRDAIDWNGLIILEQFNKNDILLSGSQFCRLVNDIGINYIPDQFLCLRHTTTSNRVYAWHNNGSVLIFKQ